MNFEFRNQQRMVIATALRDVDATAPD